MEFDGHLFKIFLLGGICEFCGSILVLKAYQETLYVNLNQGICQATLTFSGVFVTLVSYCIYRERVTWP
jgi:hypothetical protein